jgi:hypothetical protein
MTSQKNYYLYSRVLFMCKKQLERHYNEEHAPRSIALVKLDENGLRGARDEWRIPRDGVTVRRVLRSALAQAHPIAEDTVVHNTSRQHHRAARCCGGSPASRLCSFIRRRERCLGETSETSCQWGLNSTTQTTRSPSPSRFRPHIRATRSRPPHYSALRILMLRSVHPRSFSPRRHIRRNSQRS